MSRKINGIHKREHRASSYFEIDRSTVARELQSLESTIEEGAKQIEMVAAERVFDQSLSRALAKRARKLHLVARDLNRLLRLVERARMPKTSK
jgi:hypothetical protein